VRALSAAFENFGMTELFSFTTETNTKSEAVMQRINMSRRVDLDFEHPNTPGWWGARHIVYQASVRGS
jgi:RimJ/RimL family protein N-acetyltransferase